MNKKILIGAAIVVVIGIAIFAVVQISSNKKSGLIDGTYFAQSSEYESSGWRTQVVISVKNGKIISANWNAVSNIAGASDKKTWASSGKYGMSKVAKMGEWDVQAKAVEDYLVKTQDIAFNKFNEKGATDAISGATIKVKEFYELVNTALANPAIAKGSYSKDGWFYAESKEFDAHSGWKDTALVTVVNGSIVDLVWNAIYKDDTKKSKLVESVNGNYGMEAIAKKGPWHNQSKALTDAIVAAGDPNKISITDGKADAVTGASISATIVELTKEALKNAK